VTLIDGRVRRGTHNREAIIDALLACYGDGLLRPSVPEVAARAGVSPRSVHNHFADVEALRPHYAMTLRHWVARLERQRGRALQYVNEATYRVWRLYMAASALEFESGEIGIYQVLASKRAAGNPAIPLTRRHLYN